MKKLFALLVFASFTFTAVASDQFEFYGSWGNSETTGDENREIHAYGFILQIFRHNGKFVGTLTEYVSEPYDPPMGRLDHLMINEQTGAIAFETKMSLYIEGPVNSIRNSKDLYRFKGKIEDKKMVGIMESLDPKTREVISTKEIILVGSKGGGLPKDREGQPMTYKEWHQFNEGLMKERGPKW